MLVIYTIIFALVQALTEFLPVSSSGHLIILHDLVSLDAVDGLTFDVALHVGTLLALLVYFRSEVMRYLHACVDIVRHFNSARDEQRTVINLVIATIPAVAVGYFFESYIDQMLRNLTVVAITLIVGGILFFIVEKFSKQKLQYEGLAIPEALMIGLAQALALIPGVSRSGITIVAGMALHLKRIDAAKFSFLLSLPVVFGAGLKKFIDINWSSVTSQELSVLALGLTVSAVFGYVVIKYFLMFVQNHRLHVFGIYRIILGVIILLMVFL